jgi:type III restriction enzyme
MPKVSPEPVQTDLPIQAPVEEPILNSPYCEPTHHWAYSKGGKAIKEPGRRRASYFWTTQKTGSLQQTFDAEGFDTDHGSDDLPLVNALRYDVGKWRDAGYENATQVTKQLLRHWSAKDRSRRLFFCQLEAAETIIYLNEILASGRRTKWKQRLTTEDFLKMSRGERPEIAAAMGTEDYFPTLSDQPSNPLWSTLPRMGCKMATGSGKTVVMAMIITWAFCNRARVPGDDRFPSAVLICCPNLTVKERLQVLRPDHPAGSYYDEFDMAPSQLRPLINYGRVLVTNWHGFAPESPHAEGGSSYAVVDKGEERPDAFARRVLGDLYGRGKILVLNDEAHHAYRPKPPDPNKAKSKKKENSDVGEASTDDIAEATVWIGGLDKLNQAVGVQTVVDLSATPFYLQGTGHIPGSPFPWLVSDFGLVDAIESGITKIPRLPVSDTTGRPDPKFFRLWDDIKEQCRKDGKKLINGKPAPEDVWLYAQAAFNTLASQWKERFDYHQTSKPGQQFIPPVIIVVCDNTDIAQYFFEKISGETEEEIKETVGKKTKITKVKRFNPGGVPFEALSNSEERTVTLRIDSKLLAEAESGLTGSKQKEADRLRQLIANVGTKGTEGENIRSVVSVQMLTEGWDANNVTQILGLRAFGSQLLCEQVVGRGLRRISYDFYIDEEGREMLPPEYVDVYGIPFSVIPFKGRKTDAKEPDDKPKNHVKSLDERLGMEIRFPVVEGYVIDLNDPEIECDVAKVESLKIEPLKTPTTVFVMPQVGVREGHVGSMDFKTEEHDREEFYEEHHLQTIQFEAARQILMRLTDQQDGPLRTLSRHQLFPKLLVIVENYCETRIEWSGQPKQELALEIYMKPLIERLTDAIRPKDSSGTERLLPVINRFTPWGTSADVNFTTVRQCYPTQKSQVDQVVLDTETWEQSVAHQIESSEHAAYYVRNDHLDFSIPYEFMGVSHAFFPDFIVRLASGVNLVLEVKGMIDSKEQAKFEAAKRWCRAVNNWGKMGRWAFHVCKDPNVLKTELAYIATQSPKQELNS